jgi:sugar/nucleoside kinase (ribokinase family)
MSRPPKIIGVGHPIVDLIARVGEESLLGLVDSKGGMELVGLEEISELIPFEMEQMEIHSGGSAANTIHALAQLGVSCAFLGKLGRDRYADVFLSRYKEQGIALSSFKYCELTPTAQCLCLITPDAERTMRTYLGAAVNLSPEDVKAKDFEGYTHAHFEGYLLANEKTIEPLLKAARDAGCRISLGLASFELVQAYREQMSYFLEHYVDLVFANADEASMFSSTKDVVQGLNELAELCDVAAVTLGKDGALVKQGENVVEIKAVQAKQLDSTGAGDLWAAGFLHGYVQELSLEEAGEQAARLGAQAVEQHGTILPQAFLDLHS